MGVMKELYCVFQIENLNFIPTPALPESGSKGIISAKFGTPFFRAQKYKIYLMFGKFLESMCLN